jgi:choline dehydrogenase-like flavoprotein
MKAFYLFPRTVQNLFVNFFMAVNPNFVVREFQSKGVPHKLERMGIHATTEQQPDPESRITLSTRKDALGQPIARVSWKISDAERHSLMRIGQLLLEELPKAGLPTPVLADWIVEGRPSGAQLVDIAHVMGTTRMSEDPRTGVVDPQCRVHGVRGLYIAGGSVFPTGSHVNPTLMILSLALRTADQLKKDLVVLDR